MPKIYTKRGDKGTSGLMASQNIPKDDATFHALGNIDELNAFVGLLHAKLTVEEPLIEELAHILFDLGSMIAVEHVSQKDVTYLETIISRMEQRIDEMTAELPPLTHFIVPGGNEIIALCHVCRTVARRAERSVWSISSDYAIIGRLLNRLSDYLFTLCRRLSHLTHVAERKWKKYEER